MLTIGFRAGIETYQMDFLIKKNSILEIGTQTEKAPILGSLPKGPHWPPTGAKTQNQEFILSSLCS